MAASFELGNYEQAEQRACDVISKALLGTGFEGEAYFDRVEGYVRGETDFFSEATPLTDPDVRGMAAEKIIDELVLGRMSKDHARLFVSRLGILPPLDQPMLPFGSELGLPAVTVEFTSKQAGAALEQLAA